jgi:hypothetical protein
MGQILRQRNFFAQNCNRTHGNGRLHTMNIKFWRGQRQRTVHIKIEELVLEGAEAKDSAH